MPSLSVFPVSLSTLILWDAESDISLSQTLSLGMFFFFFCFLVLMRFLHLFVRVVAATRQCKACHHSKHSCFLFLFPVSVFLLLLFLGVDEIPASVCQGCGSNKAVQSMPPQ